MLCKELQYGDWCCDQHGFPMQITNVGDDYAYATFEGNEGDPWEFDDKHELGDILWFAAGIAEVMGWILEEVAQENIDKLASRKERGVIDGNGDNR